jgi:hypothetical protein
MGDVATGPTPSFLLDADARPTTVRLPGGPEEGTRMIHREPHPLAGQEARIRPNVRHPQYPTFGGSEFRVEDWWDRVDGRSWMDCVGNPACLVYAMRAGTTGLPTDNEVVYGKGPGGFGSLVHVSELEPALVALGDAA